MPTVSVRGISVLLVVGIVAFFLSAASGQALADGFITAEYSGTWDEHFVAQPSNPAVDQESMHFVWDERESAHVVGGTPSGVATLRVLSKQLTISGSVTETFAPPNQSYDCTGSFSLRPGGGFPVAISAGYTHDPLMTVSAIAPLSGEYSQSSGTGMCSYPRNGGAGVSEGPLTTMGFTVPLTPTFSFRLSQHRYTKSFKTLDVYTDGTGEIAVNSTFRAATSAERPPGVPPPPQPCSTSSSDRLGDQRVGLEGAGFADEDTDCCSGFHLITVDPDGGTFKRQLALTAVAAGGCRPYAYHWHLDRSPAALQLSPKGGTTSQGTLNVTATCPGASGKRGRALNAALHACVGPVDYSVYVTDRLNQRTEVLHAVNRWCVAGKAGAADICTRQTNQAMKRTFNEQAKQYRDQGWVDLWRSLGHIVSDNLMSPGVGGTPGMVKDAYDYYENGKNLQAQVDPDIDNADKADEAAAADPPDAATSTVTLPPPALPTLLTPCATLPGSGAPAAFADCEALLPSLAAYSQAQAQTSSVLAAVLTSQNRFATAVRAGQAGPSALQHAVSGILYVELGDAFLATERSGLSVARIGSAQGLFPIVTRQQIQGVVRAFARARRMPPAVSRALPGVTIAEIRRELQRLGPFQGARLDIVASFSHPFEQNVLAPAAGWVTATELQAVVSRLVAQADISARSGAAVNQSLADLTEATGRTERQSVLGQLVNEAEQLPGPASAFLLAAARALAA